VSDLKSVPNRSETQDPTGRHTPQSAPTGTERWYRRLIETALEGVWVVDREGRTTFANRAMEKMLGDPPGGLVGRSLYEFIDAERRAVTKRNLSERFNGVAREHEAKIVRRDGTEMWVNMSTTPLVDDDGNISEALAMVTDITERKQAEAALLDSESRFRTLAQVSPVGIFQTDLTGATIYVNRDRWNEFTGLDNEEADAIGYSSALHPDDRERVFAEWNEAAQAQRPFKSQYRFVNKEGKVTWVIGQALPQRAPDGEVLGFIGTATDITERRRDEEELERLNVDLEARVTERTAELEAFAYSVSHDLRAPLRAVQGFSDALLDDYDDKLDETGQDYLRRIGQAATRMDRLIRDLLAYSRLSSSSMHPQEVSLGSIVTEAAETIAPEVADRQAELVVDRPLPTVRAYGPALRQVVANLLSNAVKFVEPGQEARVRVWAESRGPHVRLWIEDSGIGIAPEHCERIMRVFERLHGEDEYPGTGIGLAIAKKAISRLGGHLGVESELGHGSRFWIELPHASDTP
jgi:PAS domain S-box-containing protein